MEEINEQDLKDEIAFHQGKESLPLYMSPMSATDAAKKIQAFTTEYAEPFAPNYAFSNPWANKKDNKGKKERTGQIKPKIEVKC